MDTHLLVALLFPLGDQDPIGIVVLEQPVVQRLADGLLLVVEIVDVARAYEKLPISAMRATPAIENTSASWVILRSRRNDGLTLAALHSHVEGRGAGAR